MKFGIIISRYDSFKGTKGINPDIIRNNNLKHPLNKKYDKCSSGGIIKF